ncbi:hypothetical protein H6F78_20555 [Coleofasciculus sp. FACHB-64]|uniref:hypothetical protein n=1 Tax=Cyanophyceae TaxID=3028117 RepID=UPI001681C5C9|nr:MULTISPECIES: hypothetical protein [unclassified Coleofasciculus]MBD1836693.1 hypothetical protein [Coleofasciculus sp. FACHB-501]MBD2047953.1 hypothetical protein [Coleofasciculus sp. FACHB-64]
MTIVTPEEIAKFRFELANNPEALTALDVLEECEGDLEYAAETVAIESGELQDDLGDEDPNAPSWLEKSAQKLRPHICTQAFREVLTQGFAGALGSLIAVAAYPAVPLTLVVIYITRKNLDEFCKDC